MRTAFVLVLLSAIFSAPAHARGELTAFSLVQTDCMEVGGLSFGPNGRWRDCRVTKGGWLATLGLSDLYYAQYCLGGGAKACEQQALVVFSNRAYTPVARLILLRIDPAGTEYDDPLVIESGQGSVLTLSIRTPGGASTTSDYVWHRERWEPIAAR